MREFIDIWRSAGAHRAPVFFDMLTGDTDTDADRDTMYVFFTGTHRKINWFAYAMRRLLRGRRPPVPAPFHLATGRIELPGMRGVRPERVDVPADR